MIKVDLSDDNLYTEVFHAVREAKTRYVVVYGGSGSSKSYSVHQRELLEIMQPGEGDTLVVRKRAVSLRNSCYKLFRRLMSLYNIEPLFKCAYSGDNKHITCIQTGRKLVFTGVDDPEDLKSIVAFRRIIIEEANQLYFEDFLELNRRVRGMEDIQVTLILNPTSENHWIKRQLCDSDGAYYPDTTALRFTYHDNHNKSGKSFLTAADKQNIERLIKVGENHYRVFVLAQWGIDNTDDKFCYAFSREQHVPTVWEEECITWASFDFNVNPMACIVAQVFPSELTIRAIECIKLPNSDIWQMCERLQALYPNAKWYITGDSTGSQRHASMKDNMTCYKVIQQKLGVQRQNIKVPSDNPSIEENRVLVNCLHHNWTVEIDPVRCQDLIFDLTYVAVDTTGGIVKTRTTGNKFADFLDAWRYLVNAVNAEYRNVIM